MRSIAIVTSLLLGASTLVAAQPYATHHYGHHQHYAHWDMLAHDMTPSNRQTITLMHPVAYSRIRIQAVRGQPAITQVVVLFADGSRQEVWVRARLGAHGQSSSIDIIPDRGAPVSALRVRGAGDSYSAYTIYGEPRRVNQDQDQDWHGPHYKTF